MECIKTINIVITIVFFICYAYQFFYVAVPFIKKDRPHGPETPHRFAVLIAARNEEKVIAGLIESILRQTYDPSLVTVFVVADNCTDNTAAVAREAGAVVFQRHNTRHVGKGYALEYLMEKISLTFPGSPFDGYFVFDADNVLDERYIAEMNKTFSDGYGIVTSCRNSKNFGDNWVSSGYALWFLREARYLNHARMLMNTSCAVSGTGFLFSREVIERTGGWKFFLLTEDIEFTVYHVIHGEKIGYCPAAEFFDEQPTKFRQSWSQRKRWTRGYLQVLRDYGPGLAKGALKGSFGCFDMGMAIAPAAVLSLAGVVTNVVGAAVALAGGQDVLSVLASTGLLLLETYLTVFVLGAITLASEWRRIYVPTGRKLLAGVTFPLFMLTYIPITIAALFDRHVVWQHIEHDRAASPEQIRSARRRAVA